MFSTILMQIKNIIIKTKKISKRISKSISNFLKINNVKMKKFIRKCFKFLRKFKNVLNFKKIENLLIHDFYNYKIEIIDDFAILFKIKMYFLSSKKWKILEKYLKKNLKKKFISFNKIEKIVFIFFVVKFNEQLKFCVNYRKFNVIIKRNEYSIFLINEILIRVVECKHIFKLNIISTFNKLRMNFVSEKLITFITILKTYKYHVLFFELTNDFVNWQQYMNDLLFDFLNKFCQMYMNDILIYNKNRKKHREYLKTMFVKLKQIEFQINFKICEFFKTKIIFLKIILFINNLRMNFTKIQNIIDWAQSIYFKNIQIFINFCNFYRRFIRDFFKIIKDFIRIIKKKIEFNWITKINEIFEILKKRVIKENLVFRHFDATRKTILKCDALN